MLFFFSLQGFPADFIFIPVAAEVTKDAGLLLFTARVCVCVRLCEDVIQPHQQRETVFPDDIKSFHVIDNKRLE